MGDVVARHEVLRTVYPAVEGVPAQQVLDVGVVPVVVEPVEVGPVWSWIAAVAQFVAGGSIWLLRCRWRVRLLRTGADEYVLVLVVHHIAFDGWSVGPLTARSVAAYSARRGGGEPGWAPLPVQYADYAVWQRELLGQESDPEVVVWVSCGTGVSNWRGCATLLSCRLIGRVRAVALSSVMWWVWHRSAGVGGRQEVGGRIARRRHGGAGGAGGCVDRVGGDDGHRGRDSCRWAWDAALRGWSGASSIRWCCARRSTRRSV